MQARTMLVVVQKAVLLRNHCTFACRRQAAGAQASRISSTQYVRIRLPTVSDYAASDAAWDWEGMHLRPERLGGYAVVFTGEESQELLAGISPWY